MHVETFRTLINFLEFSFGTGQDGAGMGQKGDGMCWDGTCCCILFIPIVVGTC